MNTKFSLESLVSVGLLFATASALAGSGQHIGQIAQDEGPLSIQELVRIPSLTLTTKDIVGAKTGWRLVHGSTIGSWQYRVFYRNTRDGWQVFRYSVKNVSPEKIGPGESGNTFSANRPAVDEYQTNLIQVPKLPPGPGVIPVPDDPEEPDQPAHKSGASCPVSPGVDAKYKWEWVPGHYETDESGNLVYVPGHWVLKEYTMAFAPTDFCGGN